ncbi:hypothetical protein [Sphingomonas sp. SUN039]|uniref:hypothetical protein n=1 Tax=Sphingomonas sp. SUN039 TaxID=2937787 RepID=UPI0021642D39|nr:hypothetical protein [Sphingomonas sp. SUN039]UVO55365.1 hypothetical protein M0209_14995 [Sphingomonas sp. SUN039]
MKTVFERTLGRALFAVAVATASLSGGEAGAQAPAPVTTDAATDPQYSQEIVVLGLTPLTLLNPRDLADLRTAFARLGPVLAPRATIRMRITSPVVDGRRAYTIAEGSDETTEFEVAADGSFAFPPLGEDGKHSLILSSGPPATGLRIGVMSPGSRTDARRIGDLRLECQLWWTLTRPRVSLLVRAAAGKVGPCASKKFGYSVGIGRPMGEAVVNVPDGSSRKMWLSKSRRSAWAPLWDRTVPDDAVVIMR